MATHRINPCECCPISELCGMRLSDRPTDPEIAGCQEAHLVVYSELAIKVVGAEVTLPGDLRRETLAAGIAGLALAHVARNGHAADPAVIKIAVQAEKVIADCTAGYAQTVSAARDPLAPYKVLSRT